MIYKFEIENFHSIRDLQTVDLTVSANPPRDSDRLASCWFGSSKRAPKVVAIFGANGSGKSNILRALSFVTWFVEDSYRHDSEKLLPFAPFFDEFSMQKPTLLKLWFSGPNILESTDDSDSSMRRRYCYELEINNQMISGKRHQRVLSEAMYYWPKKSGRKSCLVQRSQDGSVRAAKPFRLFGFKPALDRVLKENASVVSTLANMEHPVSKSIAQLFETMQFNIFVMKFDLDDRFASKYYSSRPDAVKKFNREIQRLDYGVRSVEVNSENLDDRIDFHHEGLCKPVSQFFESHGTRELLKLYPLIVDSIDTGSVALIDEMDATLHPMIVSEILGWYYDTDRNPRDAQLWMSCHSASLLEELSKEEILFCEKNHQGVTDIYGLNDIQAVRRNDNYYRKYLGGIYGGVPRIG